jgi:hypothetical protein
MQVITKMGVNLNNELGVLVLSKIRACLLVCFDADHPFSYYTLYSYFSRVCVQIQTNALSRMQLLHVPK